MAAPSPKPRKMSDIKSILMNPATTSNYNVYFGIESKGDLINYIKGAGGLPYTSDDQILILLSCTDASLPGSSFATHEITNDYSGFTEKHAYRRQYDNQIDLTFMVDRNYKIIRFFESWMGFITGEKVGFDPKLLQASYRVKFPKDYQISEFHVTKFEKDIGRGDQGPQLKYTFVNAFPISLSSMPISYAQTDLLKVNVTMSYTRYYSQNVKPSSQGKSPFFNGNLEDLQALGKTFFNGNTNSVIPLSEAVEIGNYLDYPLFGTNSENTILDQSIINRLRGQQESTTGGSNVQQLQVTPFGQ